MELAGKDLTLPLTIYSTTCVKTDTLKKIERPLSLNAGQKYCRMLQREHSAILSTFIKLPVAIKTFILSIFQWPFYAGLLYGSCKLYTTKPLAMSIQ